MNSTDDISKYNSNNSHYYSPVLARRHGGFSYDIPKSPKKDKKWSFGNLFRLKKKNGSDSSTDEETEHKSFLQKKKKKAVKRKQSQKVAVFDHVVIPPSSRYSNHLNGYKHCEDPASIFSEPLYTNSNIESRNCIPASSFTKKFVPLKDSQDIKSVNNTGAPPTYNLGKLKKENLKARAEARRDTSNGGDSSGDESQRSAFKSDGSSCKQKDGVLSKKSRAARTQRYLKRMSKDEDCKDPINIGAAKISNSDIDHSKVASSSKNEALSTKYVDNRIFSNNFSSSSSQLCHTNSAPARSFSGISTIPPKHDFQHKYRTVNMTNGSLFKHSSYLPQEYHNDTNNHVFLNSNNHRSLSCEANIHKSQSDVGVINGYLPLRKPSSKRKNAPIASYYYNDKVQSPPPPPPRDPKRLISVQNCDTRPISYSFDNGHISKINNCDRKTCRSQIMLDPRQNLLNPNNRSTSEDHIFLNPMQRVSLLPRPSSTTPETNRLQKLHQSYCDGEKANDYRYLTDKKPRSRKPICIRSSNTNILENQSNNNTAASKVDGKSQNTFEFWKQKDEESSRISTSSKLPPEGNRMFTAYTQVRTNIFLPNGDKVETHSSVNNESNNTLSNLNASNKTNPLLLQSNKVDPVFNKSVDTIERKSSNLEDALDELEAIYNSLHLGDEDLLDRAEQRELDAVQKQRDSTFESFPNSLSKAALSDSCYGYDQNLESPRRKRFLKRNETDRTGDDMAFRKLNKKRHNTVGDQQSSVAKISYLLASPIFGIAPDEDKLPQNKTNSKEPDITYDDVVYRNVKHSNNTLKVIDPQPPFGIPVGPISLAAPSDYLHASTEQSKISPSVPDVVKDDLAYRNLRKDYGKKPLPTNQNTSVVDDFINNNNKTGDAFKKKRAVRSLSANIYNLMHKEYNFDKPIKSDAAFNENISDIADALEIAREILRNKENKITSVRKAYMSDDELKKRKLNESSSHSPILNGENYQNKVRVNIPILNSDSCDITYKTRESTPTVNGGDLTNKLNKESALDQLITSLSLETFNDSDGSSADADKSSKLEHIIKELKSEEVFDESNKDAIQFNQDIKRDGEIQDLDDTGSSSLSQLLSEIDSFAEQSAAGEEISKPVNSTLPFLVATRVESEPFEQVSGIEIEPPVYETVANVILTSSKSLDENVITTEVFSDSEHDYANIQENEDVDNCTEDEKNVRMNDCSASPNNEDLSDEISNDIKMLSSFLEGSANINFQDCCLTDDISQNISNLSSFFQPITSEVSDECHITDDSFENRDDKNKGEVDSEILCDASSDRSCAYTNQVCFNINNPLHNYSDNLDKDSFFRINNVGSINLEELHLESLEAPKLVQNLNLSSTVRSSFDETVQTGVFKPIGNENSAENSYLHTKFNVSNSTLENVNANDCISSNFRIVPDSHNSIQSNTCDTKESPERKSKEKLFTPSDSNLNLFNKYVDSSIRRNDSNMKDQVDLVSKDKCRSDRNEVTSDSHSKSKFDNEACSSRSIPNDSRTTLRPHESLCIPDSSSNYSWYEDPSVIALACSCGIACTSQLPSFDMIFMLGLLFAVISLLLALISRL